MSELLDQVSGEQDAITKLLAKIPGFSGYLEKGNRRAADKLLRELIADRFTEQWKRVGNLQEELVSSGELMHLDDLEKAATKIQTFIDKVKNASYGYAGFFDAVKVKEDDLAQIYEFDLSLLEMEDEVSRAIDNVQASLGSDGLPAALRNLVSLSRDLVSTFEKRGEVILSLSETQ